MTISPNRTVAEFEAHADRLEPFSIVHFPVWALATRDGCSALSVEWTTVLVRSISLSEAIARVLFSQALLSPSSVVTGDLQGQRQMETRSNEDCHVKDVRFGSGHDLW